MSGAHSAGFGCVCVSEGEEGRMSGTDGIVCAATETTAGEEQGQHMGAGGAERITKNGHDDQAHGGVAGADGGGPI